jgi:hypothetical protein
LSPPRVIAGIISSAELERYRHACIAEAEIPFAISVLRRLPLLACPSVLFDDITLLAAIIIHPRRIHHLSHARDISTRNRPQ